MSLSGYLKKLFKDYFIIVAGTMICMAVYCQIFCPDIQFNIGTFYSIMLFAFIGDLPSLLFYSKKELENRQWKIRMIIHLISLEVILITFACLLKWIQINIIQILVFSFLIAFVYLLVVFLSWQVDLRTTLVMNKRLDAMKERMKKTD